MKNGKIAAFVALALLVPVPSVGAYCGMVRFPGTAFGAGIFAFSKLWLFVFPAAWHRFAERGALSFSPPRRGGFGFGLLSGLVISVGILGAYALFGDLLLDKAFLREKMQAVGLAAPGRYLVAAAYWIGINSVLEEYVWRWFVVRQCARLVGPRAAAPVSALCFTLHHIVAMRVYMAWPAVLLCAAGIFIGGSLWSWMYIRYRSVWPGYLSHALVDLCIFLIGARLIFG